MFESLTKKSFSEKKYKNQPTEKILLTLFLLFLFKFGSAIPLSGIDQEALKKSFLQLDNRNAIMQIINMYSGGGGNALITPFSLGIIPFINASILIDLLTALFPPLEKLQSEEGEAGRRKLTFYKKILTLIFSIVQSLFLVSYIQSFFYDTSFFNLGVTILELVTGAMSIIWLSNMIDNKGIGNGTSLIIFTNIIVTVISKNPFLVATTNQSVFLEIFFLLVFMLLICISQMARININVISARQLAFLENLDNNIRAEKTSSSIKENGLSIRLNQAGIFPIIIASNLIPFVSYLTNIVFGNLNTFPNQLKLIDTLIYYILIIGFNYFYTIVFWDPEKISEQLRKASVSVVNITPGQETISYLEKVVQSSSILGGIFLCLILFSYEFIKQLLNSYLLNQINISSLIILVGVAYEIQRSVRSLYKNLLTENLSYLK